MQNPLKTIESLMKQLRPFTKGDQAYGRLYADFHDLIDACEWLLTELRSKEAKVLSTSEIEEFLIDVDVKFIKHVSFHLKSLRKDINATLTNISSTEK